MTLDTRQCDCCCQSLSGNLQRPGTARVSGGHFASQFMQPQHRGEDPKYIPSLQKGKRRPQYLGTAVNNKQRALFAL